MGKWILNDGTTYETDLCNNEQIVLYDKDSNELVRIFESLTREQLSKITYCEDDCCVFYEKMKCSKFLMKATADKNGQSIFKAIYHITSDN